MGSKARRTALSVAGIALAGGASLAFAGPASAATPAGHGAGGYEADSSFKFEKTTYEKTSYSKSWSHDCDGNCGSSNCDGRCGSSNCDDNCSYSDCDGHCSSSRCDNNCGNSDCDGGCQIRWGSKHTRVVGFYRTYKEARFAAQRGGWDNFDCGFTRKGYRGWHQSWNKWGGNDWRCKGTWVLSVYC